jgi:hypothetical protein
MRNTAPLKLEAAHSALEFCRQYPDASAAWAASVARLEQALHQARSVREQQVLAESEILRAIAERDALIIRLRDRLARLSRLARAAGTQEGIDALQFKVPGRRAGLSDVLVRARLAVDNAKRHRRVLLRYGMTPELLIDLEADLIACSAAQGRRTEARNSANAAHSDLAALAAQAMLAVRHLDALNRIRFGEAPERLAAWNAARAVRWGSRASASGEGGGRCAMWGRAGAPLGSAPSPAGDPSLCPPF